MSTPILWGTLGSCSLAARILLEETGLPYEFVRVKMGPKGVETPSNFSTINPKLKVPVLKTDEDIITELPAVMTRIAQMAPERHLLGKAPIDVVRVYEWLAWLCGVVHGQGFSAIWQPYRFTDDVTALENVKAKGLKTIKQGFDAIDKRLTEGSPYAVGGEFTAVDLFLYVLFTWGNRHLAWDMKSEYPKFSAVAFSIENRASGKAAVALEALPRQFGDSST